MSQVLVQPAGVGMTIVEEVSDDILRMSADNLYGGDINAITEVLDEMVSRVGSHDVSSQTQKDAVSRINKVSRTSTHIPVMLLEIISFSLWYKVLRRCVWLGYLEQ